MTEPGDDGDLKDFLNRDSDISRRYRTVANEEPPADLDRAVLGKARAAVETLPPGVTRLPLRSRSRWMVPFALAATVLLSFAIFREAGVGTGVAPLKRSSPTDQVATVTLNGPGAPSVQAPAAMTALPEQAQDRESKQAAETRTNAAGSVASAAATTPIIVPTEPPVPPPEVAISAPGSPAFKNAIQAATTRRLPPAAPSSAVSSTSRSAVTDAQSSAERARSESDAARELRTPEVWLEEIRKLRADGQTAAADAELTRFLEENPGYFDRNPDAARP